MNKTRQLEIEKIADSVRDQCKVIDYGFQNIFEAAAKIGYRVISSGKYAVFNFKGDLPHLFQTLTNIDYFCFKNIGYEPDNKPPYFRHYSISEKKESFEFEICVPIRKI